MRNPEAPPGAATPLRLRLVRAWRFFQWGFGRYVLVGVLCALIDVLCTYALLELAVDYRIAVSLGFAAGLSANYVLHTFYTFAAPRMTWTQSVRFSAVVLVNYALQLAVVWLVHRGLEQPALAGKILSLPIVAANGYWLCRQWVFTRATERSD